MSDPIRLLIRYPTQDNPSGYIEINEYAARQIAAQTDLPARLAQCEKRIREHHDHGGRIAALERVNREQLTIIKRYHAGEIGRAELIARQEALLAGTEERPAQDAPWPDPLPPAKDAAEQAKRDQRFRAAMNPTPQPAQDAKPDRMAVVPSPTLMAGDGGTRRDTQDAKPDADEAAVCHICGYHPGSSCCSVMHMDPKCATPMEHQIAALRAKLAKPSHYEESIVEIAGMCGNAGFGGDGTVDAVSKALARVAELELQLKDEQGERQCDAEQMGDRMLALTEERDKALTDLPAVQSGFTNEQCARVKVEAELAAERERTVHALGFLQPANDATEWGAHLVTVAAKRIREKDALAGRLAEALLAIVCRARNDVAGTTTVGRAQLAGIDALLVEAKGTGVGE